MTSSTSGSLRFLRLLAATSSVAFAVSARGDFVYTQSFTVNQTVPDFGEFVSAPVLSVGGTITDVDVGLVLTALANDSVWSGDYYVALGHDTGYAVLLNRIGKTTTDPFGSGHDGLSIVLDDSAPAGDIHLAAYDSNAPAPLTGTWASDGRETDPAAVVDTDARTATLDSFNGLAAAGEWRLFIADDSPGGTAILSSWSLALTLAPDGVTVVNVASGATLTTSSNETLVNGLVNQGLVVAGSGSTLTLDGAVTGAGNYQGNFVFTGSYSPGNSPAAVNFDGDLTFGSDHVLTMEIGGITPGTGYDTLTVTGLLTLGGTLEIVFIDGFIPDTGDGFDFFTASSIGGTFSLILLPEGFNAVGDLAAGDAFALTAVPEPATYAALLGACALGLAALRRRRTK